MVERVETRPGRIVSPEETDRIRGRYDNLLRERPDGPFHLPDALMVAGRGPGANRLVNVAVAVDATLAEHDIMSRDLRRRGRALSGEVILEIAEAIGEPRTTRQERDIRGATEMHRNGAVLASSAVLMEKITIAPAGVIIDGEPTASTVREGKPAMRRKPPFIEPRSKPPDGAASAKPVEAAELKNVGPYALSPIEVYVLAFGLCMINRLFSSEEDKRELRMLGLRLTQGEFEKVHEFIERKPEQFDLAAVVAQIHDKVVNLIDRTKRKDVLGQNNPEVARLLLRRFADFRDQQSLDEALEFMFRPLGN